MKRIWLYATLQLKKLTEQLLRKNTNIGSYFKKPFHHEIYPQYISLFISLTSANAQTNDTDDIKRVFKEYKSAILNDQANDALNAIDKKTINYYKSIL